MPKSLSEMTLTELWELFPIQLREYNPRYPDWYEEEKTRILSLFPLTAVYRIHHIGSTAVNGLTSKPIIDILLEINTECQEEKILNLLQKDGWIQMSYQRSPMKISFNKGYTPEGFAKKVYHLHVRRPGDWDELYFRDYLQEHPDAAAEYAKLKQNLLNNFEHDRDGYTAAKTPFVCLYTEKARKAYNGRYAPSLLQSSIL